MYRTPLGPVIARLVTTFRPYGFVLTAPVFEYLDLPELLDQEVAEDLAYGMVGKTAIHPTQIAPIEQHYKVTPQDLAVARAILDVDSPAVFRMHDSMCEVATHRAWAERMVEQSHLFGAHRRPDDVGPQEPFNPRKESIVNTFPRGQKGKLADLGCGSPFNVDVDINAAGMSVDVSCFGLDGNDKLSDDRYMVFYNQLASPDGAVRLDLAPARRSFAVNLDALPASIAKLVFVAAIDGAAPCARIGASTLTLGSAVHFPLVGRRLQRRKSRHRGRNLSQGRPVALRRGGPGFQRRPVGAAGALWRHRSGACGRHPAPAPAAPPPEPQKVSLSKITLEKRGDKVSLDKRARPRLRPHPRQPELEPGGRRRRRQRQAPASWPS